MDYLLNEVQGGFDQDRFGDRIGFSALKGFLEADLSRRYAAAVPKTSAMLQKRRGGLQGEKNALDMQIAAAGDVVQIRSSGMSFVAQLVDSVGVLLAGSVDPDPAQFGSTLDEEWAYFSNACLDANQRWPGVEARLQPPNSTVRLYGGAAFDRTIAEFQAAANACSFPQVSMEKFANVMLSGVNGLSSKTAAKQIARITAQEFLGPLIDRCCDRLAKVLHRLIEIAVVHVQSRMSLSSNKRLCLRRPDLKSDNFLVSVYEMQWQSVQLAGF